MKKDHAAVPVASTRNADELANFNQFEANEWVPFDVANPDQKILVVGILQATLAELVALHLSAKQARWNVQGALFYALHDRMNEYAAEYLNFSDQIAERSLHIGSPVDLRLATVAETANLGELPTGFLAECHLLTSMTERTYIVAVRIRQRIEQLGSVDSTTSQLLDTLSRMLDKQVWQLRSHMR
ncbi:Dps family protein [Fibrivirga algicola]|uniref:DNA starvation/stationary phase protection protein n=1 Tax=Fibrivirga algicola TaxID=2950420 RepID=A0ABX0QRU5_9BACT|nr:ferritin-like domain-containing protein [Fibrivirga algicola]NID13483.1 DNA starvation/stationary phase protection protein [Fibrivirga algicola]